jgi:polysaccharide export outer membrane protein
MKKTGFSLILLFLLFSSCNTSKKILYFQDIELNKTLSIEDDYEVKIVPNDLLSINVSGKDPVLAAVFNLYRAMPINTGNSSNQILGYTVDSAGNIDFPVLGTLHAEGLTRKQLALLIKTRLVDENLINDPVVTIEYMNLKVNVMGEVARPGGISFNKDRITLLEALSMAGDLTIYGKRDGVYVIREVDHSRTSFKVDLRSVDLFSSPAYYLQQNDVVYVEPNNVRAGQSTINENNVKSISLWLSITSLLVTVSVLIFK